MTIYYLIPDIFRNQFSVRALLRSFRRGKAAAYLKSCMSDKKSAIGGVKVFYQHIICLRELGYDAHPIALGDFDGNLFYPEIKSIRFNAARVTSKDIVVSNEFHPYDGLLFDTATKIMFAQSWVFLIKRKKIEDRKKSYRDLGYDHVISCGEYIRKYINGVHNEECYSIQNGIDEGVFFRDDSIREENRIICLTRKNPKDIETIKNIVERQVPNVNFVPVDGLSEQEIALEFRKSDIFLASGYPEGLPLPPLEALHSGCVVVGFAGRGGREYLIHEKTAMIAEDGDAIEAAEHLIHVLQDKQLKESIRKAGSEIVKIYSLDAMKKRVGDFYSSIN